MLTGNMIQIARAIEKMASHNYDRNPSRYWQEILFRNLLVELGCGFIGPTLCCHLKKVFRNKEDSYAIIITSFFMTYILLISSIYATRYKNIRLI